MRYAIVSDLHGNWIAWRAVLRDIATLGVDRILCLGDVVGYGPQPAEVLESVYEHVWKVALGNHDAVVCGRLSDEAFHPDARRVLEWTRRQILPAGVQLMASWPFQLVGKSFRCAHACFYASARFLYIEREEDAALEWSSVPEPLLFVGHTHRPALFVVGASGTTHSLPPQDFVATEGRRYLVNVGSVGIPRDGDVRASYVIYDVPTGSVMFRKVPFDLDAFRDSVRRAGVESAALAFLGWDPLLGRRPLREVVYFRPPEQAAATARGGADVEDVDAWRGRARRWRRVAFSTSAALGTTLLLAGGLLWYTTTRSQTIPSRPAPQVSLSEFAEGVNALYHPDSPVPPFQGWTVRYGDRRAQQVWAEEITDSTKTPAFRVCSKRSELWVIESDPIQVQPRQRVSLEAVFRMSPDWTGTIAVAASVQGVRPDGHEYVRRNFLVKEPSLIRREGRRVARETVDLPAGARTIQVRIEGRFCGEVLIESVELTRRPARE